MEGAENERINIFLADVDNHFFPNSQFNDLLKGFQLNIGFIVFDAGNIVARGTAFKGYICLGKPCLDAGLFEQSTDMGPLHFSDQAALGIQLLSIQL